jgi:hypothetical protein
MILGDSLVSTYSAEGELIESKELDGLESGERRVLRDGQELISVSKQEVKVVELN